MNQNPDIASKNQLFMQRSWA